MSEKNSQTNNDQYKMKNLGLEYAPELVNEIATTQNFLKIYVIGEMLYG
jgi:hypothetical protein